MTHTASTGPIHASARRSHDRGRGVGTPAKWEKWGQDSTRSPGSLTTVTTMYEKNRPAAKVLDQLSAAAAAVADTSRSQA
jgi:hypothetical protein